MKLEELLFYMAVAGDLVLFAYAIRNGYRAFSFFRKKNLENALWSASAACGHLGLAILFPWSLVSHEREIGKAALLICIITPFVVSMSKLWPSVKGWISRAPMLAVDVAIMGMVVAFAVSGNWVWFWIAGIAMAVIWIVARKVAPKKLRLPIQRDEEWERLHDLFGEKSPFFSDNISDPNDPSWSVGK